MGIVVSENSFTSPVTLGELVGMDRAIKWCLDIHGCHGLYHAISADGLRAICVHDCPDAEAMRRVADQVRPPLPPRIWPATRHFHAPGEGKDLSVRGGSLSLGLVARNFDRPVELECLQEVEDARDRVEECPGDDRSVEPV